MFVNIIESYRNVVAICDSELLGKRFEELIENQQEKTKQLHIKESFYKGKTGKKYSKEEVLNIMKNFEREDSTFNIVGQKSISAALKAGIINKEQIAKIQKIPYALVLL